MCSNLYGEFLHKVILAEIVSRCNLHMPKASRYPAERTCCGISYSRRSVQQKGFPYQYASSSPSFYCVFLFERIDQMAQKIGQPDHRCVVGAEQTLRISIGNVYWRKEISPIATWEERQTAAIDKRRRNLCSLAGFSFFPFIETHTHTPLGMRA